MYAQLPSLQTGGTAIVENQTIARSDVLHAKGQTFVVEQMIANCRGGDATAELDCTLALLLDTRFQLPERPHDPDDEGLTVTSGVFIGLGLAATAALGYGLGTCEFEDCRYVMGIPLLLVVPATLVGSLAVR